MSGYDESAYTRRDAGFSPEPIRTAALATIRQLRPSGVVLDVGSGSGSWLELLLAEFGEHVTRWSAVDIVDDGAGAIPGVDFSVVDCSVRPLPFDDETIDAVTAIEVVEHLTNPRQLIGEIARCLRPGGWFLFTTPNNASVRARVAYAARAELPYFDDVNYERAGHITPVMLSDIGRMAAEAGLAVETVDGVGPGLMPKTSHRWPTTLYRRRPVWFSDGLLVVLRRGI